MDILLKLLCAPLSRYRFGIYSLNIAKNLAGVVFRFVAPVAQLVEHVLGKDEVSGSSPVGGLIKVAK